MTTETEHIDLPTLQDVAKAQADGLEIEVDTWPSHEEWEGSVWMNYMGYRDRPRQPVMKEVKILCYFDQVIQQLVWSSADAISGDWIRQPHLDMIAKVPCEGD